MKTNRRTFLHQIAIGSAGLVLASSSASLALNGSNDFQLSKKELDALRKNARNRKRRIIMNNDGNDVKAAINLEPINAEIFLKQRTLALAGSQVDSIFYCDGVFNNYTHQSKESELLTWNDEKVRKYFDTLFKQETDPLKMTIDFGHKNGMEVFWSMRMNDTHDSGKNRDDLFCNWKREHPDYLVGKRGDKFPYGANRWSSVNYEIKEVREKVFRILYDVCSRYDIDGIELDYFRHPVLFKQQMTGEPVSQSQYDIMTEFMDRVYKMTVELGEKRGRPFLIAIRIPDSVGYCKEIGIDLLKWLDKDYVDIISTGDYFKLEPWENLASLGKKFKVPVYACFENRRIENSDDPEGKTSLPIWRGEALNAWKAGVDGIYVFNRFKAEDKLFKELGDPKLLEKLEHIDQTIYVKKDYWSRPEVWLKDGDKYVTKEIKKF
jgi:hypothetical protein